MAYFGRTDAQFTQTNWSLIRDAAKASEPGAELALNRLCAKYNYPIYAFLRRKGSRPHDAEDLTNGFFAKLLTRDWLADVGPSKGKFRSFLLACLMNYVRQVHDSETGPMRCPEAGVFSMDASNAEQDYLHEMADGLTPAELFERRWATTLIKNVVEKLRQQYSEEGKAALFDSLRPHLIGDADYGGFAETANKLGLSQGAARVAATRLRDKFKEAFRAEVAATVQDPRDVDGEIRHIIGLFSV